MAVGVVRSSAALQTATSRSTEPAVKYGILQLFRGHTTPSWMHAMARQRQAKPKQRDAMPQQAGAAQQSSDIATDLIAFAGRLKANVKEAITFCDTEVEKRIGWDATKNAETHFFNRAKKTSKELRQRRLEFDEIDARCKQADPCRPVLDDLEGSGLRETLDIVSADLEGIAARSRRPLTDADRDALLNELQGCRQLLIALHDAAEWIEDEAAIDRGGTVPGRTRTQAAVANPLSSPEIEAAVQDAERVAKEVIVELEQSPASLEPRNNESTLASLKRLGPNLSQIERTSNKVLRIQKFFTDRHRRIAKEQGHDRFLQFLETNERVSRRIASRRRLSTQLVRGIVERLTARLSLTDDSADRASGLDNHLDGLMQRLQSDQRKLEHRANDAANERAANAVTAEQLPAWRALSEQGKGDTRNLSKLQLFLKAFAVQRGNATGLGEATRKQLKERLRKVFAKKKLGRLSDRQFEKLLVEAQLRKTVFKCPRPMKSSRTLGDEFELFAAAIKKYRHHLVRP